MSASSPFLTCLRDASANAHQDLEAVIDINASTQTLSRYSGLLKQFHAFHSFYEPVLTSLIGAGRLQYHPAGRRKLPWLEEDLVSLGESPTSLPPRNFFVAPQSESEAWGCAYVIEGSTLGGRKISALLDTKPWIPGHSRRFFTGYGVGTRQKWSDFVDALEDYAAQATEVQKDDAARMARVTFECLNSFFSMQNPQFHE